MTDGDLRVRSAAVAGSFYPASADTLRLSLRHCFDTAVIPPIGAPIPIALVVPHAGYQYSGPIPAGAYRRLVSARTSIRRVVLLGPSHRVPVRGLAVPSVNAFETPLGLTRLDRDLLERVLQLPAVTTNDLAHAYEHSLEVQLPFLQTVLDEFTLLPLCVGDASPDEVAVVLEGCWGSPDTLVVVSTDLSHYHPYADANRRGSRTAENVLALRSVEIHDDDACGARPLRGLLDVVARHRRAIELVDIRNSGDTAGDRSRVVGYGAFAVV